ncbi:hypothetical protein ACE1OC_28440 [Streptomyces sp. DSM 116496]|uniref:hypothetical protein n=1 Tax=Streptomyces stoeckheimensis TaxID=3344656 RepID=UPI0038B41644
MNGTKVTFNPDGSITGLHAKFRWDPKHEAAHKRVQELRNSPERQIKSRLSMADLHVLTLLTK